ncbi:MAG TPA: hypothetical protein VF080_14965 [Solirubrobacteraceae bacterium]
MGSELLPASSLVDFDALWKIVVAGFAGGAGAVVAFGFVLLGRSRYAQARDGDVLSRGSSVLLAALGGVLCAAALIVGFVALTKK